MPPEPQVTPASKDANMPEYSAHRRTQSSRRPLRRAEGTARGEKRPAGPTARLWRPSGKFTPGKEAGLKGHPTVVANGKRRRVSIRYIHIHRISRIDDHIIGGDMVR